jgi:hypothetical protein
MIEREPLCPSYHTCASAVSAWGSQKVMSEELLRRLDAYTAQGQAAQPYLRLSCADVLWALLDKGLSVEKG